MSSSSSSSSSPFSCHCFTLDEIKKATNNFDEEKVIGQGGEGKVYLANIYLYGKNEKTPVAVKHLKPNSSEFEKEIQTISKIHHPNLVSLLGYCQESGQKILVYEYMQKGSLSDYVKKKKIGTTNSLPWKRRLEICIGAARGLQHLHTPTEEWAKGIIHRDIKPANILLDKNWVAKVSDFGLSKLSHAGQTNSDVGTYPKGTSGYFAPEIFMHNKISRKIDVYAFGVVMFEVLCRKSPWDRGEESYFLTEEEDLGLWARENVDSEIKEEISGDSLDVFTDIIRRCLQREPTKRPTMDDIVLDLESCRICAGCNEQIGRGRFLLRINEAWHPECFHCHHCDLPIHELEWSLFENCPFHDSCYAERYHPRCDVCENIEYCSESTRSEIYHRVLSHALANQNANPAFSRKHWRLLRCQNGLRIFEELIEVDFLPKSCSKAMKAVGVVEASCEEIFELVMSMDETRFEWDSSFQDGSLVEEVDGHTAILHHRLQLDWFPTFVWPRDLCYMRYWRRNDDGSYVVLFCSRDHENCGPQPGFVRAHIESGGYNITPLKPRNGRPRTQVQHLMQIDLKGWAVGYMASFQQHCLLQMLNSVAGLRKYFSQ